MRIEPVSVSGKSTSRLPTGRRLITNKGWIAVLASSQTSVVSR